MRRHVAVWVLSSVITLFLCAAHRVGAEQVGPALPAAVAATLTQGGPPNFADTFATPHVATANGMIVAWKAQFVGGRLANGEPGVPAGIQLKVLRAISSTEVQVVAAGSVHDPRPALQARFGAAYPFFPTADAVLQFTDQLPVSAGDIIGLTIKADPAAGAYFYPLVAASDTRMVLQDVGVGGIIDLSDPFTGTLAGLTPALEVRTVAESSTLRVDGVNGTVTDAMACPERRDTQVYQTIGKAIDCAQSGDVISIAPGTYPEQVVLEARLSGLTVRAEDGSVLEGAPNVIISPPELALANDGGIVIRAGFVTLMGLKVVDATAGYDYPHVLVSLQADNISLLNSWVVGRGDIDGTPDRGVSLQEVSGTRIEGNTFLSNSIGLEAVNTGPGTLVEGNLVQGNGIGLLCTICGMLSNDGNTFSGNRIGIQIENSTVDGIRSVHRDLFVSNGIGLLCTRCGMLANDGNTFSANEIAIHIENSTLDGIRSIQRDLFVGNGIGLLCTRCGMLLNDGNTFSGNEVAIQIQGSAATGTPTIHHDHITGNGAGLKNLSGVTIDAQSNYWGCPTGPNTPGCDMTSGPADTAGWLNAGGIDIRPGGFPSFPNPVNPTVQGRIPVAILTTSIFDASTTDVATVRFGATGSEAAPLHSAFEDVDFDGDLDLVVHFDARATDIGCASRSGVLTGRTRGGTLIHGSDSVRPEGCK